VLDPGPVFGCRLTVRGDTVSIKEYNPEWKRYQDNLAVLGGVFGQGHYVAYATLGLPFSLPYYRGYEYLAVQFSFRKKFDLPADLQIDQLWEQKYRKWHCTDYRWDHGSRDLMRHWLVTRDRLYVFSFSDLCNLEGELGNMLGAQLPAEQVNLSLPYSIQGEHMGKVTSWPLVRKPSGERHCISPRWFLQDVIAVQDHDGSLVFYDRISTNLISLLADRGFYIEDED
jgi:hypothetical protein